MHRDNGTVFSQDMGLLPPGEDPMLKQLVLPASLQVFDRGALFAASQPWHKLLFNLLLFMPIP